MTTETALHALGVRPDTLTPAEREQLDDRGYLMLPGILSAEQVRALAARLEQLAEEEGERAGWETHQERGAVRLSDLVNKDPMFDIACTHPRVLAAVHHVIPGELKLSSLNSRAALPGQGSQHLHADWEEPVSPGDYRVCNTFWLLSDFTPENGATRVVPGTHRSGRLPKDEMPDPGATHPREVLLLAPAGTVVVVNSHLWHGGTLNRTNGRRLAFHGYFCRRDCEPQTDQRRFLRPETHARLTPAARYILDVN
jgi:ectoine hydroxylase-related dioxygenase (phytanoyl-CoA dioxygenase family)